MSRQLKDKTKSAFSTLTRTTRNTTKKPSNTTNATRTAPVDPPITSTMSTTPPNLSGSSTSEMAAGLPDVIKYLPTYDGNPYALKRFIESVEEILLMFRGTDETPRGQMFLRAIRNKIEGKASELLDRLDTPLNWDDIKRNLTRKLLDNRDELSIIEELHEVPFRRLSISNLYDTILDLKRALSCLADSRELPTSTILEKKNFYVSLCLRTFIKGLNPSLRNAVKVSRPITLDEAFDIAIRERDEYLQKRRRYPEPRRNNQDQNYQQNRGQPRALPYSTGNSYGRSYGLNSGTSRQNNFSRAIMPPKPEPTEATSRQYRGGQFDKFSRQTNTRFNNLEVSSEKPALHNLEETENFQRPASGDRQDT